MLLRLMNALSVGWVIGPPILYAMLTESARSQSAYLFALLVGPWILGLACLQSARQSARALEDVRGRRFRHHVARPSTTG